MKAMIFAAGLGTRLRPLTNDLPKALVPVGSEPLLGITIKKLKQSGFDDIIINVHHFADKIVDFLEKNDNFGIRIQISHEAERPLETGGGLKKARHFFDDGQPFLICNADILSSIDLRHFYQTHIDSQATATLAVRKRASSRYLLFDTEGGGLCGRLNDATKTVQTTRAVAQAQAWAFSGFHIIDPIFLETAPEATFFSIIDWYLDVCNQHTIRPYDHSDDHWCDIGKPETLAIAQQLLPHILEQEQP